jgi:hypothetical protein
MSKNVIEPVAAKGTGMEGDITTSEKVYTFRTLQATDMFLMFRILGKIGVNEFAKSIDGDFVKNFTNSKDKTALGISITLGMANLLINNLPKCEAEIYEMLSNTSNLSVEQVKGLDFCTFTEMVIDFIKKEEFKDFIKVVSKLFK